MNVGISNADFFPKSKEGRSFVPVNLAYFFQRSQTFDFIAKDNVAFELFSLKNPEKPQILSPFDLSTITSSNFNKSSPTRIYVHGWMEIGSLMKSYINDGLLSLCVRSM